MSDIFISYSREDRIFVERLVNSLKDDGYDIWWDPAILPGDDFKDEIREALDTANCVIVVWSRSSLASYWVKAESSIAMKREILVPLLLSEDIDPPEKFNHLQTENFSNWDGNQEDTEYKKLTSAINKHLQCAIENKIATGQESVFIRYKTLLKTMFFLIGAVLASYFFTVRPDPKIELQTPDVVDFRAYPLEEGGSTNQMVLITPNTYENHQYPSKKAKIQIERAEIDIEGEEKINFTWKYFVSLTEIGVTRVEEARPFTITEGNIEYHETLFLQDSQTNLSWKDFVEMLHVIPEDKNFIVSLFSTLNIENMFFGKKVKTLVSSCNVDMKFFRDLVKNNKVTRGVIPPRITLKCTNKVKE